jgi:hypothetical protein
VEAAIRHDIIEGIQRWFSVSDEKLPQLLFELAELHPEELTKLGSFSLGYSLDDMITDIRRYAYARYGRQGWFRQAIAGLSQDVASRAMMEERRVAAAECEKRVKIEMEKARVAAAECEKRVKIEMEKARVAAAECKKRDGNHEKSTPFKESERMQAERRYRATGSFIDSRDLRTREEILWEYKKLLLIFHPDHHYHRNRDKKGGGRERTELFDALRREFSAAKSRLV